MTSYPNWAPTVGGRPSDINSTQNSALAPYSSSNPWLSQDFTTMHRRDSMEVMLGGTFGVANEIQALEARWSKAERRREREMFRENNAASAARDERILSARNAERASKLRMAELELEKMRMEAKDHKLAHERRMLAEKLEHEHRMLAERDRQRQWEDRMEYVSHLTCFAERTHTYYTHRLQIAGYSSSGSRP